MKFRTRIIASLIAVLAVVSVIIAMQAQQQKVNPMPEEATPIQVGVMTEKQKEHSKLFKHAGPRLTDLATKQGGDINVQEDAPLTITVPKSGNQPPALQSAVCNADAVVIGVLTTKSAQLTEDGSFVFTDHEMKVEEIIKNNSTAPIQLNGKLTITRDGGSVQINGRNVRAAQEGFRPTLTGRRYLFFLRFLPATGAYLAYGNGSFEINGDQIMALGDGAREELLAGGSKSRTTFLSEVRTFTDNGCESK